MIGVGVYLSIMKRMTGKVLRLTSRMESEHVNA